MRRKSAFPWHILILLALNSIAQMGDSSSFVAPDATFKMSGSADGYFAYYTDAVSTDHYEKFPSISTNRGQFGSNIYIPDINAGDLYPGRNTNLPASL